MSSTFSLNKGSLLSLKVRNRWGFSPCLFQIRRTDASLSPLARAIVRVLQCVASDGFSKVVMRTTFCTFCAEIFGFRPGRGASFWMPSIPCRRKRPRHRATLCRDTFSCSAINRSVIPSAAIRIILARNANLTDEVRARAAFSSDSRNASVNLISRATRIVLPSYSLYDTEMQLLRYL